MKRLSKKGSLMGFQLPLFLRKLNIEPRTLLVAAAGIATYAFIEANGGNGVTHLPPERTDIDNRNLDALTPPKPRASACLVNRGEIYMNRCDEPIKVFVCVSTEPEWDFVRSIKTCNELRRIAAKESFNISKQPNQDIGACYISQDIRVEIGERNYTCS